MIAPLPQPPALSGYQGHKPPDHSYSISVLSAHIQLWLLPTKHLPSRPSSRFPHRWRVRGTILCCLPACCGPVSTGLLTRFYSLHTPQRSFPKQCVPCRPVLKDHSRPLQTCACVPVGSTSFDTLLSTPGTTPTAPQTQNLHHSASMSSHLPSQPPTPTHELFMLQGSGSHSHPAFPDTPRWIPVPSLLWHLAPASHDESVTR